MKGCYSTRCINEDCTRCSGICSFCATPCSHECHEGSLTDFPASLNGGGAPR